MFSGKKERDVNPLYETVDPGKLCEGRLFPIESEDDCDKAHLFLKENNAFYKDVVGYYIISGSSNKPMGCFSKQTLSGKLSGKHFIVWNRGQNKTGIFGTHSKIQLICKAQKRKFT